MMSFKTFSFSERLCEAYIGITGICDIKSFIYSNTVMTHLCVCVCEGEGDIKSFFFYMNLHLSNKRK